MPPCSAQISETGLHVEVRGDLIIVTESATHFFAVYAKPSQPQLILRRPTPTDDHELLARVWQAVNTKARELGWIV
jgi:hypothetical protein